MNLSVPWVDRIREQLRDTNKATEEDWDKDFGPSEGVFIQGCEVPLYFSQALTGLCGWTHNPVSKQKGTRLLSSHCKCGSGYFLHTAKQWNVLLVWLTLWTNSVSSHSTCYWSSITLCYFVIPSFPHKVIMFEGRPLDHIPYRGFY